MVVGLGKAVGAGVFVCICIRAGDPGVVFLHLVVCGDGVRGRIAIGWIECRASARNRH